MKYYLIAGEASADLHASNLMTALREQDKEAEFRFLGGNLMQGAGGVLVKHYRQMAFMGFLPVLLHLPAILNTLRMCKADILSYHPDAVILVDYPGFNLKIARYVKTVLHLPVFYYISPKIWAWKRYRIKSIRKYVDRMLCILPFEAEFYQKLSYRVDYVGNPSVDSIHRFCEEQSIGADVFRQAEGLDSRPILAILAGSRRQEISKNLPVMLQAAASFTGYQMVIAGAPGTTRDDYNKYIGNQPARIVFGKTYHLLQHSRAALVTSGTATLEAALFRLPQVVCYHTPMGKVIGFVFRHCFAVKYISLVNLIAGREVVKELFADRFTKQRIRQELDNILNNETCRQNMLQGYNDVVRAAGPAGASRRAAALIAGWLGL